MAERRRRNRVVPFEEVLEQCLQSGSEDEGDEDGWEEDEREDENDLMNDVAPENNQEDEEVGDSDFENEEERNAEHEMEVGDEQEDRQIDDLYDADTDIDESSDEEEDIWCQNLRGFPRIPTFTGVPGLHIDMDDDSRPIDFYRLFMDDDILRHIMEETNRYATSCIADKRQQGPLEPRSIFATWKPVTVGDVKNFISICLHMGLVHKPQIADYWSVHPGTHTSYASQLMPRERFSAILAFLHLVDNTQYVPFGDEDHDPIFKLRPFLRHLQQKFQEVYTPTQQVCVDEAMCPFKGRSRFRVYMKDKPTKWGFKFYECCESESGYVHQIEMFCADRRVSNRPYDVTMRMEQPLLNKGYQVFIDNYYCEPKICADLAAQGTMVCGTVRKNRVTMPRDLPELR
ncbi:piggyBac transposable element-derived protein 4-like [Littorina saxatilis]|uniref:piggyBac transposable element-derived protein 4-like n=1 Tax=Littorina saxatilis TaxID=31220 RepID=UPI0038B41AAB